MDLSKWDSSCIFMFDGAESHHQIITTYRLAATQLNWAYIAIIALSIEGARKLFETKTEIRRKARQKAVAKAEARGEKRGKEQANERWRETLRKHGVQLPPKAEQEISQSNAHRLFGFLPFFASKEGAERRATLVVALPPP